jgi:hypothetical protein
MSTIQQHQGLMAAVAEGDVEKMSQAMGDLTHDFRDASIATDKDMRKMVSDSEKNLKLMKEAFDRGDKDITKEMVQEAIKRHDRVLEEQRKFKKKSADEADNTQKFVNEKIEKRYNEAVNNTGTWVDKMSNKIRNARGSIESAGEYMVGGLNAGIDNKWSSAIGKAQSLVNAITSTINNGFKIASPSKVMMWVGQMIDEGLGIGMERYAPTEEAANMVSDVLSSAEDAIDDYGYIEEEGGRYEDTQSVIINMTINGAVGQDVEELANIVSDRLAEQLSRRKAVYA